MVNALQNMQAPDRKVGVGAGVGGMVAVLVWGLNTFAGIEVSGQAGAGMVVALTFVAQYLVPNK